MENNKQTAVEWLIDEIEKHYIINNGSLDPTIVMELKRQAKEMHKQEIIESYRLGHIFHDSNDSNSAQEYYDTEYGKQ